MTTVQLIAAVVVLVLYWAVRPALGAFVAGRLAQNEAARPPESHTERQTPTEATSDTPEPPETR